MPVSLIIIAFVFSIFSKNEKARRKCRNIGIALLFFFTNPFFSSVVMNAWELHPIEYQNLTKKYEYGILLTGITDPFKTPEDRVHFNKGADRLIHTLELYKKGIINKIIISGGSGSIMDQNLSESKSLSSVLLLSGVSHDDIIIESKSRNTHENALYTHDLLSKINFQDKVLLITSAFHMRRARACFAQANVNFDCFPTDYYSKTMTYTPDELVIPNVESIKEWTVLFKEWIGYTAYFAMGYL